ncbi:MAG: sigma-54-dependent Fis family transcriptional regulator [Labilithrix sp.]|nr:sigma-54-dependent Fis family transcriptional regulator [Labilithrix sp.]MCW5810949.1 sigma-54-dependent Fis family transcriptional regulator [Labilithrix sp.]
MNVSVAATLRPTSRGKIVGRDPRLANMLETIDRVARSSCTVLVSGESGTGKELVVAALHDASDRRAAPLVTINCGAIPNDLVESELFGHVRGAFTGATTDHHGHVAAAEGGTLFLDEIGELPLTMQVKLLRVLQQREYTPLGATEALRCDVRVVAATNRDLEAEVGAGRFREDLYYRLDVIHLALPPLRERTADLRLLARHFCRVFAERAGRDDLRGLSDAAFAAIEGHPWPGNVRALENALERGVLLARGPFVEADDVFGRVARRPEAPSLLPRTLPSAGLDLFKTLESYQNSLIRQALERTSGNRNRAARLLGMNRTTLVEMIRRRGL